MWHDVTANIARVEWSPSHMRSSTAPTIAKGIAVCMVRKSLLRTMPTCQLLFRNFQTQPYDGETGFPISSTPPLVVNSGQVELCCLGIGALWHMWHAIRLTCPAVSTLISVTWVEHYAGSAAGVGYTNPMRPMRPPCQLVLVQLVLVLAPVPGAAWEYTLALKKDSCIWESFWKWSDLQVMAFSTRMVWWLGWFGGTSISGNLQILLTESWTINLTQSCLSATFSISNLAARHPKRSM